MKRRLKAGMVGGGRDAFIGGVHRMAMRLDGKIELVAGAFSSNAEKSRLPARIYCWTQIGFIPIIRRWWNGNSNCRWVNGSISFLS